MWNQGWGDRTWSEIDDKPWDVIIIGGGITGAGVLRTAVDAGLRVLLLEARDFSFGTSSRSSKLVHGGFRYLRNKQYDVTRESVREREWMLHEAPHLVTPLGFCMPSYKQSRTPAWQLDLGVIIYDLMAPKWAHRRFDSRQFLKECPALNPQGLKGGHLYFDAQMDDSRLVLRILSEAMAAGGTALNYARVTGLLRTQNGQACGVIVQDQSGDQTREKAVEGRVVINATGPWTDDIRQHVDAIPRMRKLRGSHLIFSQECFPLNHAVTLYHPIDNRAMFALPWEGASVIGTTDLDHSLELETRQDEPCASQEEIEYIMDALHATFPGLEVGLEDILSSFAGLRPIIGTGKTRPSDESRAHGIFDENGLLTITGGKLTTFRIMANQVLQAASPHLPGNPDFTIRRRIFDPLPIELLAENLPAESLMYLAGRYGKLTSAMLATAQPGELENIQPLPNLWAELRWAARAEGVVHLDDLLLRRVRLGMLLPNGAFDQMERIRKIVQPELGWNDAHWMAEENKYRNIWQRAYSPAPLG
jgi:glycerol-3-phosphate dehydrogenase